MQQVSRSESILSAAVSDLSSGDASGLHHTAEVILQPLMSIKYRCMWTDFELGSDKLIV